MKTNLTKMILFLYCLGLVFQPRELISSQNLNRNGIIITADKVEFEQDPNVLTAFGNVVIYYDSRIVSANSLKFYQKDKKLKFEGQIKVKFNDDIITLAKTAELSDDLKSGIIFAANTLINNTFQVRSEKIIKLEDGSSEFFNSITSSCQICPSQPDPIWDISAKKIVHDRKKKVLIFTNAKFSILGFPIFYTPYLRTPEPGIKRASGFLPPSLSFSSASGLGYKQPYFQVFSPSSDTTFSLLLSQESVAGADIEYRQRFQSGDLNLFLEFNPNKQSREFFKTSKIVLNSKLNADRTDLSILGFLVPSENGTKTESFFRIKARTKINEDTNLSADLINNTDRDLLSSYGYESKDRLVSNIRLTKIQQQTFQDARVSLFTSLRNEDVSATEPQALPDLFWRNYGSIKNYPISYGLETSLLNLNRSEGRDVLRVSSKLDLQNRLFFPNGIKANNIFSIRGSAYNIQNDTNFPDENVFSVRPLISTDITLPLLYRSQNIRSTITPRLQIVYSEASKLNKIPNEDSVNINFDETNIFSLDRYPGIDKSESGLRVNAGMEFSSIISESFGYTISIGEIFRFRPNRQFSSSSGINGYRSDIILTSRASFRRNYPNVDITSKLLLDQNMALKLNETSLIWSEENYTNTGTFVYLVKDANENRPKDQANLNFGTNFNIGKNWNTSLSLNRDFINNYFSSFDLESRYAINNNWTGTVLSNKSFSEASVDTSEYGLGLSYQNECSKLDISFMDYVKKPDTRREFLISFSTPLFSLGSGSESIASALSLNQGKFNPSSSACVRTN